MKNTSVLFFLHLKDKKEITYVLKRDNFTHPVCLDEKDAFNKLNKLPTDMAFQTFLLNKDNKVVAIGNPIHNPKVKKLYFKVILGDGALKQVNVSQTDIKMGETSVDMGTFDWRKEQRVVFTITNTGESLLIISDVVTSCGCTSVEYTKELVRLREELKLIVKYKADELGHFSKSIKVFCNTNGSPLLLRITGEALSD